MENQQVKESEDDGLVRLTVVLGKGDLANIELASAISGKNETTCIATAVALYRELLEYSRRKNISIGDRRGFDVHVTL